MDKIDQDVATSCVSCGSRHDNHTLLQYKEILTVTSDPKYFMCGPCRRKYYDEQEKKYELIYEI